MKKFLLPIAIVMIAVGGAFASQQQKEDVLSTEMGWINSPTPCNTSVLCSNIEGPLCTINVNGVNHQAFGKVTPTSCTKVLYRN